MAHEQKYPLRTNRKELYEEDDDTWVLSNGKKKGNRNNKNNNNSINNNKTETNKTEANKQKSKQEKATKQLSQWYCDNCMRILKSKRGLIEHQKACLKKSSTESFYKLVPNHKRRESYDKTDKVAIPSSQPVAEKTSTPCNTRPPPPSTPMIPKTSASNIPSLPTMCEDTTTNFFIS